MRAVAAKLKEDAMNQNWQRAVLQNLGNLYVSNDAVLIVRCFICYLLDLGGPYRHGVLTFRYLVIAADSSFCVEPLSSPIIKFQVYIIVLFHLE
jgi:hypothetical protein